MALGAALATGKPQAYAVVPGPGLLNSGSALLTAYGMNAPVLALIGQIPDADIGRGLGHLHEICDQACIISRLVDFSAKIDGPDDAGPLTAKAFRAMTKRAPWPGCARMRDGRMGRARQSDAGHATPAAATADRRRLRFAKRRSCSARRSGFPDRGGRRRAGCISRSDADFGNAAGTGAGRTGEAAEFLATAVRSASTCRSDAICGARPTRCWGSAPKLNPMTAWGIDKKLFRRAH